MSNKIVKHIRFGEGVITKEENGKVFVQFEVGEKKFPYTSFENYVTCYDTALQEEFLNKAAISKAEKEASESKSREKIKESMARINVNKSKIYTSSSKDYNCWIKFEGPQNEMLPHEVMGVKDGNRTLYILNYVKRPSGVKEGARVFIASGIQDDYGNPQQVITGRGILAGYDDDNVVKPEWIEKHGWMAHYSNYLLKLPTPKRCVEP